MIIGEERAVGELWEAARRRMPRAARGPARPARLRDRRAAGAGRHAGCAPRRPTTSSCSCPRAPRRTARARRRPARRATPRASAGARARRSRTAARGSGSRTAWSASRPRRRPGRRRRCRCSRSGSTRRRAAAATARAALRDLCRLLLEPTPAVTLFVRTENAPAIALYESIGMRVAHYRSLLFERPRVSVSRSGVARTRGTRGGGRAARADRAHIRRHELIAPGGEVLCLVSGGADSTLPLPRAARARLPGLGAPRRPRAARRGVRRGRALLRRGARRRGRPGRPRAARTEAELRDAPLRVQPPTGCARPGHTASDQVETILYRLVSSGTAKGIKAAPRGRRRAPAPAALARGDGGVLPRARARVPASTRRTPTRCAA